MIRYPLTKRISVLVDKRDLWVGFWWDSERRWLYALPVPCVGIVIQFPRPTPPSTTKT